VQLVISDAHTGLRAAIEAILIGNFIAAEALANASKHARANQVTIRAELDGNWVRLDVTDDGIGGARLGKGFGLQGMVDRAEAAGGRLELKSPSGGPTAVAVRLPVATPHADSEP
jgi:signal transduction histidine kinase